MVVSIQAIDHTSGGAGTIQKDLKMDYCGIGRCLHCWIAIRFERAIRALLTASAETSPASAEVTRIREINETMAMELFHGKPFSFAMKEVGSDDGARAKTLRAASTVLNFPERVTCSHDRPRTVDCGCKSQRLVPSF